MHVVEEDGGKRRQKGKKKGIDLYGYKLCYKKALRCYILDCLVYISVDTIEVKFHCTHFKQPGLKTWIRDNILRSSYDETNLPKVYHPKSEKTNLVISYNCRF